MRFLVLFSLFFGVGFAENFSVSTTAEFRQALKIASENNLSNTIVLQSGFYSAVEDAIGQFEYISDRDDNLTIIGADKNTTLSGFELSRVFYFDTLGTVTLKDLTIIDGFSNESGGAIYVNGGSLTILDSNISNNSSDSYGGAIYGHYNLNIEVANSTFTSNSAYDGGAISGSVTANSSTFTSNSAYDGGAISGSVTANSSTFTSNSASDGGAISGSVTANSSTFTSNSASWGGAIYGSVTANSSTFTSNSAAYDGGAISGSVTAENSIFTSNSAGSGGAISGSVTAENSIFTSNSAAGSGGAISGSVTANSSTFTSNSAAGSGGAIYGSVTAENSIFTSNSANNGGAIYGSYGSSSLINVSFIDNGIYSTDNLKIAYSFFDKNSTINFSDNTKSLYMFSNYLDFNNLTGEIDHNFSNIQAVEGDTLLNDDFTLPADSVLIDRGGVLDSGAVIYAFGDLSTVADFECNERVVGDAIDIGAIEFGGREGNYCDSNYSIYDNNYTDINYSNNITIDGNLTIVCAEGWTLDENRSVCVQENPNNYETSDFATVPLDLGWSLRAVDMNVSDIPQDVSIVWTYSNGNWSAFSPNGEMTQKIEDNNFEMTTDILSSENGTWFLSERKFDLIVPKKQIDALQTPTPSNLSAENLGWNLLGTNRELPAELISCQNGDVRLIWKFFQNEWILFAPNINPSLYDLMFNTILPNEGFWVLCE
jgi:predicted outer membrane repeat protein